MSRLEQIAADSLADSSVTNNPYAWVYAVGNWEDAIVHDPEATEDDVVTFASEALKFVLRDDEVEPFQRQYRERRPLAATELVRQQAEQTFGGSAALSELETLLASLALKDQFAKIKTLPSDQKISLIELAEQVVAEEQAVRERKGKK